MPICPQITNTSIPSSTWYVAGNFTVDNTSQSQPSATTYYASSAPSAKAIGDTWFDTSNGNKQYRWDGSSWVAVQDTSIAAASAAAAAASAAASSAQSTANAAQSTANGKNKVTYSTSAASGSGTTTGDIWFQYTTGGVITAQWTWNGSSWVSNTLNSTVIASLDAGKITAGTISVALTLQAATITGGSININSGTFQVSTGGAVTISAGSLNINSGTFQVTTGGALTATSATITGTINATGGYIGSSSNGWIFDSAGYLRNNTSSTILFPTTSPGGTSITYAIYTDRGVYANNVFCTDTSASSIYSLGGMSISGGISSSSGNFTVNTSGAITNVGNITSSGTISTSGNISATSGSVSASTLSVSSTSTFSSTITANGDVNLGSSQELRVPYAYSTTVSNAATVWISSTGQLRRSTASSQRYKTNIVDLISETSLDPHKLLNLQTRAFKYKSEYLSQDDPRAEKMMPGFIAEEVAQVYPIAADIVDDKPESWNERMVIPGMLALIQEHEQRLAKLEGK